MLYRDYFEFRTKKGIDFFDITEKISKIVEDSKIQEGLCNIFFEGTTGGLMINENNKMLIEDFKDYFESLASESKLYHHPTNAFSHIRASMVRQNLTIPIANGKLILGEWQSIIFWEFDITPRKRRIIVTIQG